MPLVCSIVVSGRHADFALRGGILMVDFWRSGGHLILPKD